MKTISGILQKLLNVLLAVSLSLMCLLVFGNVLLRYLFNSGITWSEEFSRFLFVWMIFLGAIGALKDNEHLGMEMLVKKLPTAWRKSVYVLSNLIILYILWLIFDGSRKMTLLNLESYAPATGMPLAYLHVAGMIMSAGMTFIVLFNLCRLIFQNHPRDILNEKQDSGDPNPHMPIADPLLEKHEVTGGHR